MATRNQFRTALLAASALAAAGAVTAAHAETAPYEAARVEVVAPVHHAADEPVAKADAIKKVGIAAAATAALAALFHLIGAKRIGRWFRAAAPVAAKAASAVAAAPIAAAKAVGRAAASPVRFALLMAGLGVFALTGFSLFDVEWAGGLLAGGAIVALAWTASARTRRALVAIRTKETRRTEPAPVSVQDR
ncbi:MAG TPA: hypothetical protein PLV61_07915 [Parvularculaceae bacterium]|nr:hypothetical protein [Caulobacterales bacterium]HPE31105.1 hypothetical protein [Parvularculaceae bacterium]HRX39573.1 hypothetical protein [Parvularculaceae bacterium]